MVFQSCSRSKMAASDQAQYCHVDQSVAPLFRRKARFERRSSLDENILCYRVSSGGNHLKNKLPMSFMGCQPRWMTNSESRVSQIRRPARAIHRASASGQLVDTDQMARPRWCLHLTCPQIGHSPRRAGRPSDASRKSAKAVTGDVLAKLLATCAGDGLRDLRDRAILMVAFGSGGRRRSEIAGFRVEQLTSEPSIEMPDGPPLPSLAIHLGRTKTTSSEQDNTVRPPRSERALSSAELGVGAPCQSRR